MMDMWKELLRQAYIEAVKSPDPSTQNGALVVDTCAQNPTIIAGDCNRLPRRILDTPEIWNDRALKYKYVHHAERTVLDTARRTHGLSHLDGHTVVCPWAACTDCAKELIAAGITTLVTHKQAHERTPPGSTWFEEIVIARQMFHKAGVRLIEYDGIVGAPPVRHSGVVWTP